MVLVPIAQLAELEALLVAWREEARLLLQSDQPSADQILMIHAICRTLRLKLPISAFATRLTADAWIREKQARLGARKPQFPRRRAVS